MSIARHTSYNFLGAVVPLVVTIIVTPFYLNVIGVERYGILAIFWTLLNSLNFFSLGMGPAIAQRLGALGEASPEERSQLVWTGLLISLAAGLLGALAVLVVGHVYFDWMAETPGALQQEIRIALPWLAAGLPLVLMNGVFNGALQGRSRFGLLNLIQVAVTVLTSVVPLAIAHAIGPELSALVLGVVMVNFAALLLLFATCRRIVPLRGRQSIVGSDVRRLLSYGGWVSATGFLLPLVMLVDRFLIGAIKGPAAVSAYVLPYNLVQRLVLLPASLTSAALPRFAGSDREQEQRLQNLSLRALTALLTPMAIAGMALLGPFLHLWVGKDLAAAGSPAGYILILGFWLHGIGHVPSTVLLGRGRPDLLTKLLLAYLLPYLAVLYVLTVKFGIAGAALAWTLRSLFDPVLFVFTRPRRNVLARTGLAAMLLVGSTVTALVLPWNQPSFWALMALLLLLSLVIDRAFWRERAAGQSRLIFLPFGTPSAAPKIVE